MEGEEKALDEVDAFPQVLTFIGFNDKNTTFDATDQTYDFIFVFPMHETPELLDKIIYLAMTALHYKSYCTGAVEPVESMDYIGTLQPLKVEIGACILSGTKPLSHKQHSKQIKGSTRISK